MTLAPERAGAIEFIRRATVGRSGGRPGTHGRRWRRRFEPRSRPAQAEHASGQRHRLAASPASEPDLAAGGRRRADRPPLSPTAITSTWRRCAFWRRQKGRRGRSWSATPARWPGCRRALTATGPSIPRARSSWPVRPIWRARTRGSRSACATCSAATGWTLEQAIATVTTNPARLLGDPCLASRQANRPTWSSSGAQEPAAFCSAPRLCTTARGSTADARSVRRNQSTREAKKQKGRAARVRPSLVESFLSSRRSARSRRRSRILAVDPVAFELLVARAA